MKNGKLLKLILVEKFILLENQKIDLNIDEIA